VRGTSYHAALGQLNGGLGRGRGQFVPAYRLAGCLPAGGGMVKARSGVGSSRPGCSGAPTFPTPLPSELADHSRRMVGVGHSQAFRPPMAAGHRGSILLAPPAHGRSCPPLAAPDW
jgi:hypothetical protein